MKKLFHFLILILMLNPVFAQSFLPVDKAFHVSLALSEQNKAIAASFMIEPGYHLYQEFIEFKPIKKDNTIVTLGKPELPAAHPFFDGMQNTAVFAESFTARVPIIQAKAPSFTLRVSYQGCSSKGICYPPVTKQYRVNLELGTISDNNTRPPETADTSKPDRFTALFSENNLFHIAISFFLLGLLLSFTPCVLPMVPILSGIIIGHRYPVGSKKAFLLSLSYVLGMAVVFACLGFAIGLAGGHLQATMQSPGILIASSLLFILLALSLFDVYNLSLPSALLKRITHLSHHQQGGTYLGVFIMGALATLIVSPCVSAPLVGALTYIAQTGHAVTGSFALFMMGFGMGLPLILIGTSGGKLLPKAGAWMNTVKYALGVLMIAIAIWLIARILPGQATLMLWSALLIVSAVFMGLLNQEIDAGWPLFWRAIALLMAIYGTIMLVGAAMGETDPYEPLAKIGQNYQTNPASPFETITSLTVLHQRLAQAKQLQQPVILDFYAQWCTTCKAIDKNIFANPLSNQAWAGVKLIRVDVTIDNTNTQDMQAQFGVFAPPVIIFISPDGSENKSLRIVGDVSLEEFLNHMQEFKLRFAQQERL